MTMHDVRQPRSNAPPLGRVDKATFFEFVQHQPEQFRYEYVRGRIMQQMAGGTRRHAQIAARFLLALSGRVDETKWVVLPSDRAIDTGPTIRYADIVVEPAVGDPDSLSTETPVIAVEVLSKTSEDRDLFLKPSEYLSIPSLEAYIVASQNEPLCIVWMKDAAGRFPIDGVELRGHTASIEIPMLSDPILLAEIYRGVQIAAEEPKV
jgi:Uma2 family endonuclease